jgi:putative ABC transport system permease protein
MDILEVIKLSISVLRQNILRTLLTMLGIIIGIASVIIILSLGQGTTASIVGQISSFGANNLTISPGAAGFGPIKSAGLVTTLVREDALAIKEEVKNVIAVSSIVSKNYQLVANGENTNGQVSGVDAGHLIINNLELVSGSFIQENEVAGSSRVVVLGDEKIIDLFGEDSYEYVIGKTVRIDSRSFRIIGVINDSRSIFIPVTTAMNILMGQDYVSSITVMISDSELVDAAEIEIETLLLNRHEIMNISQADFNIRSSQEMISTISTVTGTLIAMLSAIAAISLIVGGIGIMNIMLVTVTERTKEIGLMKAIGAKQKDILTQFLIESVVLTLSGGIIGAIIGISITFVAAKILSIPFIIGINSILLAVGVSAAVGIIFGYYPAKRGANLSPIDALRYE